MILRVNNQSIQSEHIERVVEFLDGDKPYVLIHFSSKVNESFGGDDARIFLEQWQRLATVEQIQTELQALQQNMAAQAQQLQAAKVQYEQALRNQPGGRIMIPH